MVTEALNGYVLHLRETGETSAYAHFFTREKGIVHARVKGAKNRKKQALLQPFMPLWIVLDERPYGAFVQSLEIASFNGALKGAHMLSGLYVNELLYRALHPDDVDLVLFECYETTIQHLASDCDRVMLEIILRRFEWTLIESLGAQVSFIMQADGATPLMETEHYRFVPHEGFMPEGTGFLGAHLLSMGRGEWEAPGVLLTAKRFMRQAIHHVLDGATLNTRALFY